MKQFWKWNDEVTSSGSELILDGSISNETWFGDEITPQLFRDELNAHTGDITVAINSGGGDVFAGLSIYNALINYDGTVTVRVDGLVASIASIIAMAGDKVIMSAGSMMMIHNPWVATTGNAKELEKSIEVLKGIQDSIVPIYVAKTGLSEERVIEMLDAETWLTAEEAVDLGFADEALPAKAGFSDVIKNALSGKLAFNMSATRTSIESLEAKLAEVEAEKAEVEEVVEEEPTEEVVETEAPEEAEEKEADEDEVEAEAEPVTEAEVTEVEDEPVKATEEEVAEPSEENKEAEEMEIEMEEIAKAQVIKPSAQAQVEVKASMDYLNSKASIKDFAEVLRANAGKSAGDVKDAWEQHLVQMGISNPEVLLPTALISEIEDAFKEGGEIWNLVRKTGLTVFKNAIDTVTGENSRAKGHTKGETKDEQVITLADRTVRAQFIYKYIVLDKETIRENQDTGALVRYVLTELPRRIIREIERAIVIGDGRSAQSKHKISSFTSLKADSAGATGYAQTYVPQAGETKYETLLRASALVKADGAKYLIAKSGYLIDLLIEQGVNGGFLFAPGTDVARVFGFAGVIEPDWFDDASDTDNDAYIFVPSAYTCVGDNSIESFTNFALSTNEQEYLQEIYAGGALTKRNSGVAIASDSVSS